jgi:hypothetical protein
MVAQSLEGKAKRPVGRPRGSGPKQIVQAQLLDGAGADTVAVKRAVGRPRKNLKEATVSKGIATQVEFGNFVSHLAFNLPFLPILIKFAVYTWYTASDHDSICQ